jgi:hypothetical protein
MNSKATRYDSGVGFEMQAKLPSLGGVCGVPTLAAAVVFGHESDVTVEVLTSGPRRKET